MKKKEKKPFKVRTFNKYRPPRRSYPSSDYSDTRSQTGIYQVVHYPQPDSAPGTPIVYDSWLPFGGSQVTFHNSQVTTSVPTPGWRKMRVKPDKPFTRYKEYQSSPMLDIIQNEWIKRTDIVQTYPGQLLSRDFYQGNPESFGARSTKGPPAADPAPELVSKLLSQLQSAKANTAVAMAELNKTAAFVTKTALKLVDSYTALRHLRFRDFAMELGLTQKVSRKVRTQYRQKAASFKTSKYTAGDLREFNSKFAAEAWLEYSYAWKPLLKDVYDHADALAQTVVERQGVMREAKAKVKTEKEYSELTERDSTVDFGYKSHDQQWQAMEVRFSVPPGTVSAVRAFGLINPLEVAWELVPFSFVADWFLPIGDAIRNLTATVGLTFHSGWKTTRTLHTIENRVFANGRRYLSGNISATATGSVSGIHWWFEIHRTLLTDFPSPTFPQWKDPRGLGHKGGKDLWTGEIQSSETTLLQDSAHGLSAIALLQVTFTNPKALKTLR